MNQLTTINQSDSLLSESKFEHALRVAKMMSQSQMVPKQFQGKPQDIILAMEFGRRLGLGELQAVQNIAVVNGRPAMWGDAVLAACQGHPDFEYIKEEPILAPDGSTIGYRCTVKRRSYPDATIREFTTDDAKRAGLLGRNVWAQYQTRMLQMRARGFALRDTFADALSGVQVREEVEDYRPAKDITPGPSEKDLEDIIIRSKEHGRREAEENQTEC